MGFPDGSGVKNPPPKAGDAGLMPGSGRSPGGGNGNPLQYSCWDRKHCVYEYTELNTFSPHFLK